MQHVSKLHARAGSTSTSPAHAMISAWNLSNCWCQRLVLPLHSSNIWRRTERADAILPKLAPDWHRHSSESKRGSRH